MAHITGLCQGT